VSSLSINTYMPEAVRGYENDSAVPRTFHTAPPHGTRSEDHMLRTDRSNYTNSPGISDPDTMSNVAFGFRPECAWPGSLFEVFLQGSFVTHWHQQKDLEYSIAFEGHNVKAVLHEMESFSQLGARQHVLQCTVPQINKVGRVPITLALHGLGGKPLTQSFLGFFQCKPNSAGPSRMY
jgi:hypothetical protein